MKKKRTEEKFIVTIYCKEEDINVNQELNYFNTLFLKHCLRKMGHQPFEVTEIISIRRDYFSTYVFSSRKKW